MSITLFCLVKGQFVGDLKKVIKAEITPEFDNFPADKLKLWKVSIPTKQESAQLTAVSKISVNIKDELGGVELSPVDKLSKYFDDEPIQKNLHIIVDPPTDPQREKFRKPKNLNLLRQLQVHLRVPPFQEKSDEAEIESQTIHISTDVDLASIICTSAPKVKLDIVVDTSQQFSWYTYSRMKTFFGLRVDDYYNLPTEHLVRNGDISDELLESVISEILRKHMASPEISGYVNEATCRVFISSIIYAVVSTFGGDIDIIICVTEAKKMDLSHGIGQSSVQAHASMQCNRKKRTYADADLYDEEMFCIISTGVEWIITKVILKGNDYDENNSGIVEVRVCLPRLDPIPLMKLSLTRDDIREPVAC
ncbi:hypothetical protein RhiirA1_537689 [Rhizophagus irregularis]|uniref:Crinkler effector protein N-terminal domain-containing protein n=1 Tax=Rhizophagus irregularis TaxID=588596 RepID=A0A2I1ERE2_9GLOM|nr:hypothetical protein RhiirA1_537689 [Rhizophagus irregularis]PKY24713.1 hypothetical protein RhiirB3_527417 [Rhizophagus irregularis]